MNEINWLVSLLVAIPLSIAGNLLTPLFQNWKASKSKTWAAARLCVVEREFKQASRLAADNGKLNTFLLVSLISIIVLFALPSVFGGFASALFAFPEAMGDTFLLRLVGGTSGMGSALFNLMAIIRATQALTVYRRVRNYAEYENETNALLERLRSSAA